MTIPEAQAAALELARTVKNAKKDPREIEREAIQAQAKADAATAAQIEADAIAAAAKLATGRLAAVSVADVDFRWSRLTLADKVESTRTIPPTPCLAQQLATLTRVTLADGTASPYEFASNAKGGRSTDPRAAMTTVKRDAGILALTVHGRRRSFSLLGEAPGAPLLAQSFK